MCNANQHSCLFSSIQQNLDNSISANTFFTSFTSNIFKQLNIKFHDEINKIVLQGISISKDILKEKMLLQKKHELTLKWMCNYIIDYSTKRLKCLFIQLLLLQILSYSQIQVTDVMNQVLCIKILELFQSQWKYHRSSKNSIYHSQSHFSEINEV